MIILINYFLPYYAFISRFLNVNLGWKVVLVSKRAAKSDFDCMLLYKAFISSWHIICDMYGIPNQNKGFVLQMFV